MDRVDTGDEPVGQSGLGPVTGPAIPETGRRRGPPNSHQGEDDMHSDIEQRLRELHDYYAFQVNVAIEEGREHLIEGLVARYPEEAARLMAEAGQQAA